MDVSLPEEQRRPLATIATPAVRDENWSALSNKFEAARLVYSERMETDETNSDS